MNQLQIHQIKELVTNKRLVSLVIQQREMELELRKVKQKINNFN